MNKFKIMLLNCIIILLTVSSASAQHVTCDGNRYKHNYFTGVDSAINVKYGQNYTMNNIYTDLNMDIYQPQGDPASKRPLIIFIHYGGFLYFDKTVFAPICKAMALRGFVSATIDYRLSDRPLTDSIITAKAMVMAISDAKGAIRFFVEDAATTSTYKIDTNYIFVAGASSGGITAAHLAFLDSTDNIPPYLLNFIKSNGGFTGNSSNNTSHSTPVKGVLNYSGALIHKEFISKGEPALFSAHDLYDTIVPCNSGLTYAIGFPWRLEGSCGMHAEAKLKGIYNKSFYPNSSEHCGYFDNLQLLDTVLQKSADFLYDIICPVISAINQKNTWKQDVEIIPNPATSSIELLFNEDLPSPQRIKIYNLQGMLVVDTGIENKKSVPVNHLENGIYFLRMNDKTIKFIKY